MKSWIENELQGCKFRDERLGKRLLKLTQQLSHGSGESIPLSCQDWASTKAAYRLFANDNISDQEIFEGHFQATKSRFAEIDGPILVLHDTSEIAYQRSDPEKIGIIKHKAKNNKNRTSCGVLMHTSLVITPEGLPLGLSAVKFWNRKKFKGTRALRGKFNLTKVAIEEKESFRWIESLRQSNQRLGDSHRLIHIGDRESDIYEFFSESQATDSNFLVRICANRRIEGEFSTIYKQMEASTPMGVHRICCRDANGFDVETELEIRFQKMVIQPPLGQKRERYPNVEVNVIFATEIGKPQGSRKKIIWKLITDLSVNSLEDAVEKLQWYALRWKIEVYFNILKSGCGVEGSKLRTAESLFKFLSIFCIISWRIFWMTMINRESQELPAKIALTEKEMLILDTLKPDRKSGSQRKNNLSDYILKIAKLGGYLARSSDPPPGNKVIWRGMAKLLDIHLGLEIGQKLVGN